MYAAGRAIDKKFYTCARTEADSAGITWLKVTFDKVHCISKVIWYRTYFQIHTWTCTNEGCSNCVAEGTTSKCDRHTLTVSTEGETSNLPFIPDCRHGNSVKMWKTIGYIAVGEIVTIGKYTGNRHHGVIPDCLLCTNLYVTAFLDVDLS